MPTVTATPRSVERLKNEIAAFVEERTKSYGYGLRVASFQLTLTSSKLLRTGKVRTIAHSFVSPKVKRKHITAAVTDLSATIAAVNEKGHETLNG